MYKRGGIYHVEMEQESGAESEVCPCLVVSNNISNEFSPVVTVIPLSFSNLERIYDFETFLPAVKTGLALDAKISSHLLFTIDKTKVVSDRRGFLSKRLMVQVDRALRFQLGL
ncbi:MAG TPA: type II toxin-antitoxin system PemK/MazF family toxin [Geobacteraceae bacterium]|nr:type II toxin-antitoxin system PemK/MazF family toxin [Geobacteraceae bacterium]